VHVLDVDDEDEGKRERTRWALEAGPGPKMSASSFAAPPGADVAVESSSPRRSMRFEPPALDLGIVSALSPSPQHTHLPASSGGTAPML